MHSDPAPNEITAVVRVRVVPWFLLFAGWFVAACTAVAILSLHSEPLDVSGWKAFQASVNEAGPVIQLLILGIYLSLACTFIPLNTSWIISVAAIAPGVTGEFFTTVLAVAAVGAFASTLGNLNDYHVFSLMLRSQRIAKIRASHTYQRAERWFATSPFGILMFFNVVPIPVDVSRPLAVSHGYPRIPFAAANFLGRFLRYLVIASVTYLFKEKGWMVTVGLLALATVMVLAKGASHWRKRATKAA